MSLFGVASVGKAQEISIWGTVGSASEIVFSDAKRVEIPARHQHQAESVDNCRLTRVVFPNDDTEPFRKSDREIVELPKVLYLQFTKPHVYSLIVDCAPQ